MSKYTTIAQIKADIKLSYAKILDFYSEIQADTHGMAYLIVEMKDNTTLAEIEALYFTPAVITDMEGKNTLFRETYHSVTSRFFSNNTCWKLIFAIHFISPTRLNKILFFYCIIMHYPV